LTLEEKKLIFYEFYGSDVMAEMDKMIYSIFLSFDLIITSEENFLTI
jgi:hypothetical protein